MICSLNCRRNPSKESLWFLFFVSNSILFIFWKFFELLPRIIINKTLMNWSPSFLKFHLGCCCFNFFHFSCWHFILKISLISCRVKSFWLFKRLKLLHFLRRNLIRSQMFNFTLIFFLFFDLLSYSISKTAGICYLIIVSRYRHFSNW